MGENAFVISAFGVRSPRIIYGTAWKKIDTAGLVTQAISHGFRGIDTACQPRHYHEAGVGAGIAAYLNDDAHGGLSRADLYLQSKFTPLPGQDPRQIPYDPKAPPGEQVAQSFRATIRNLQTDYVDGLLLHSPITDAAQMTEVWQAMEAIFASGAVRQLGISNCYSVEYLDGLYRSVRVRPAVLQNRFYAGTSHDRGIREFCRQHRIIYQSFWTLTANPQVLVHDNLRAVAGKYGRTPAQILFRYLTQEDVVPLTGTRSATHMREDLEIFEFELTLSERELLTTLF